MKIIGIDPGKSGGLAFFDTVLHEVMIHKMPATERDLWDLVNGFCDWDTDVVAYVENPTGSQPTHRGVQGIAKLQYNRGLCVMAVIAAEVRLELVSSGKWQRVFGLYGKGYATNTIKKNAHKARAQELFPNIKVTHAISDALLIAEYGRRIEK